MTTNVAQILYLFLTTLLPAVLTSLIGVILFANISPLFALLLGFWLILHFIVCFLFIGICDRYENIHGEIRSSLLGKIVDSLTNNFVVNLFYRFPYEKKLIEKLQVEEEKSNHLAKWYVEIMRVILGVICFLCVGLGINGYMIYCWLHGELTTGQVVQIFNTGWNITNIVWVVGFTLPTFFQSLGIAKQALSVMNDPKDVVDTHHAKPLLVDRGEIIFDNVTFHYGHKKLFRNKNVHIRPGEKVGLVGYSGAGKTTFINLILRFFPLEQGRILVDGNDISHVTLESLRSQIALIPQDPLLFHRSLKANIHYGRIDATDDEVLLAAKLSHCDDFVSRLNDGYESIVGERGTKLSGGERQRVAIARAILSNAPILILDEATSALDSVTEKHIQQSLQWLMQNRTSIVIAHRLSTLSDMDRILVFDKGVIVEEGSHQELLDSEGHYARMWSMQAGGFLPDDEEGVE